MKKATNAHKMYDKPSKRISSFIQNFMASTLEKNGNLRSLKKYQMTLLIFLYGLKLIQVEKSNGKVDFLCSNEFLRRNKINKKQNVTERKVERLSDLILCSFFMLENSQSDMNHVKLYILSLYA